MRREAKRDYIEPGRFTPSEGVCSETEQCAIFITAKKARRSAGSERPDGLHGKRTSFSGPCFARDIRGSTDRGVPQHDDLDGWLQRIEALIGEYEPRRVGKRCSDHAELESRALAPVQ